MLFLLSRIVLLRERWGQQMGFDTGAHLEMVEVFTWMHPDAPLRDTFYGYHPPLGFLLPRAVHLLFDLPILQSVQVVSFAFSLLAFFALRATLKRLELLRRLDVIAFLYICFSLPLQIFLATSLNLDVQIFGYGSFVLYCSVRLFWRPGMKLHPNVVSLWMGCAILCALFTKFSGVLLFAIPFIVSVSAPGRVFRLKRFVRMSTVAAAVLVVCSPYYYGRYYSVEASLFPTNTHWFIQNETDAARDVITAAPLTWFRSLVSPTSVHWQRGIVHRDYEILRLTDTWRDLWIKDQFLGHTTEAALSLGKALFFLMPFVITFGLLSFIRMYRRRRKDPWMRLGWIFAVFAALQFAAFLWYMAQNPFPGWGPAKGIYITPVSWALSYFLVFGFVEIGHRLHRNGVRHPWTPNLSLLTNKRKPKRMHPGLSDLQKIGIATLAVAIVVMHAVPVY